MFLEENAPGAGLHGKRATGLRVAAAPIAIVMVLNLAGCSMYRRVEMDQRADLVQSGSLENRRVRINLFGGHSLEGVCLDVSDESILLVRDVSRVEFDQPDNLEVEVRRAEISSIEVQASAGKRYAVAAGVLAALGGVILVIVDMGNGIGN